MVNRPRTLGTDRRFDAPPFKLSVACPEVTNELTVVLGIPIPSRDPIFLSIVAIHVLLGIAAVAGGAIAMLSTKGPGRHAEFGRLYFWFLLGVFVTMALLSFLRWRADYPLFILGTLSFVAAWFGRSCVRSRQRRLRLHLDGMGASYILMLTAFYVDNGRNLPFWRNLPEIAFWILPGLVGVPIIAYAVLRHPLLQRPDARR